MKNNKTSAVISFSWTSGIALLLSIVTMGLLALFFNFLLGEISTLVQKLILLLGMTVCAGLGGVVWGYFQLPFIQKHFQNTMTKSWLAASYAAISVLTFVGLIPSVLFPSNDELGIQLTSTQLLLTAEGIGLAVGLVLGLSQWFVLRKYTAGSLWWIAANVLATMLGAALFYLIPSIPLPINQDWIVFGVGILTIIAAGFVMGFVLGHASIFLSSRQQKRSDSKYKEAY
jgi:hypothetical protein